jgi:PKD repeat protein
VLRVSFTEDRTSATTGQQITLTITASSPTGTLTSLKIFWGDGTIDVLPGSATTDSHVYVSTGNSKTASFQVYVNATDNSGVSVKSATATKIISDRPPVAAFTFSPTAPAVGQTVAFDASASNDPDGTITSYAWNFGDGTTGSGVTTSHVYATAGSFAITLTVTDNSGNMGTATTNTITCPDCILGHASLFQWGVRPQFKKFSITRQGPIEPIQAFGFNDDNRTIWTYVQFKITGDGGVSSTLHTQVVQLTPGQQINGNTDPRFTASFVPSIPGSYSVLATIYHSTSSTMPSIGDPSFIANLGDQGSVTFLVLP